MYLITIILKNGQHLLQFHFDDEMKARKVMENYHSSSLSLEISDSYGSVGSVEVDKIAAIFLTDLEREMNASEIVDVSRYRKDIRVQAKVQAGTTPSILTPRKVSN